MTGTFLDVDAPDTAWRASSEDPIPVIFGRYSITAAAYRYVTCRPLDGHARTNATFWHAGTVDFTPSHKAMPYQFWPGWRRGLLLTRVPQLLFLYTLACWMWPGWALNLAWPLLLWWAYAIFWGYRGVAYVRTWKHNRNIIEPIEAAAMNILRSREVKAEIPSALVGTEVSSATGRLWLPLEWSGSEGDRENLQEMLSERLRSPIACSFDMAGRTPSAILRIPKQPPSLLRWEDIILRANTENPYLGEGASRSMNWELGEDSPHLGIVGGSGSGKSELMAWIVAQFMRGGAGVIILDPKGTSHRWLLEMSHAGEGPLYCGTRAMLHDTVLWLDDVMNWRIERNLEAAADIDFPKLVVVLEERNSLQDMLRDHWLDIRPTGAPMMSPAIRALDRLSSMGRTLKIVVVLAAQATAQVDIGKKGNYGSWTIAGRMAVNHYRNVGITPKPAISTKPGRFAYSSGGSVTVFQAAYPDLKNHTARLREWATQGDQILNVHEMMMNNEGMTFTSSSSSSSSQDTQPFVTLSEFAMLHGMTRSQLDNARRNWSFLPDVMDNEGPRGAARYHPDEMQEWWDANHES